MLEDSLAIVAEIQAALAHLERQERLALEMWVHSAGEASDRAFRECMAKIDPHREHLERQLVVARMGALL